MRRAASRCPAARPPMRCIPAAADRNPPRMREHAPMTDAPGSDQPAGDPGARPRPHIEASRRVAQIMRAAEDAAAELRDEAERRADARIAEASRAADLRVAAAEDEAAEIIAEAQRQAAVLHQTAESDAERLREEARAQARQIVEEANQQAAEVQRIAEGFAEQTREKAEQDARKQVGRARDLAVEVLGDGTEMSHNLRQLSESLRRNAETILLDVQRAHRAMTAMLDDAGYHFDDDAFTPAGADASGGRGRGSGEIDDVPEFIPRSPRR